MMQTAVGGEASAKEARAYEEEEEEEEGRGDGDAGGGSGGRSDRVGGRSNESPLTELGEEQARKLGEWLRDEDKTCFDAMFASTAVRAKETARIALQTVGEAHPEVPIRLDSRLVEMSQGEWTGKLRRECYTAQAMDAIWEDPRNFKAPGGESKQELETRILEALHEMTDPTLGCRTVAIFGHGIAFKCFLRWLNDGSWASSHSVQLDNTGIIRVDRVATHNQPDAWKLGSVNMQNHLASANSRSRRSPKKLRT
ncbi:Fructose-2,6-bisphosphatase TIGAR [Hondaea fermentalgiana]|uniref:Fructose-2,6-bisphosphatase TIGAR n=1 Tax=Hondaea fermentalgiana TaxID=2315210 RepID=A0A2R5GP14_9STRA|nr:Fructose-2,6-bisphosphatase TIGAR [Hondaea fermentalgiana]|eukprot:GBG29614.1 Fructose-2,6-bisphosphatase TIGAR [Hondaea fermentalgiana]